MSEKYWLDKMNENPRYREIWEKIKELPFNETTEIILDLEAKLAECEKMVNSSFKQNERIKYKLGLITSYNQELQKENDQLKQQLAEKEKERHEEWLSAKEWKWECDRLKKELHTANQETLHFQNKYFAENQTAIAELEKVKNKIYGLKYNDNACLNKNDSIEDCVEIINQQIKELKGDK